MNTKIKVNHIRNCDCEAWPFCSHAPGEGNAPRVTILEHKTFSEKMAQAKADKRAHEALLETGEGLKGVKWTEYWKAIAQRDELLALLNKIQTTFASEDFAIPFGLDKEITAAIAKAEGKHQ